MAVCSERILKMEEAVGMIGHNERYFGNADDLYDPLYEDSLAPKNETIEHTGENTNAHTR